MRDRFDTLAFVLYRNNLETTDAMANLKDLIASTKQAFEENIKAAASKDALEKVRVAFLGRNGTITELMSALKQLSVEEKRVLGPLLNDLKTFAQEHYQQALNLLEQQESQAAQALSQQFDVTGYRHTTLRGSTHIYSQVIQELEDIFISMGYDVVDGPEIDTDYFNFTALNIPHDHPARDMFDTFWLNVPGLLLRTHTSTAQIHAMQERKPPFALFAAGRVFRNEAVDASHDFMFSQGEIIFVDKNVSLAHLLATTRTFLQAFFKKSDIEIRARPGYFPFVEPGIEIDASCPFCQSGCSVCKKTGWIELLGSGLIHPNVLRAGGIDPDIYSGFAVGFGLTRLIMLRHSIPDIRLLHSDKIEFLRQF